LDEGDFTISEVLIMQSIWMHAKMDDSSIRLVDSKAEVAGTVVQYFVAGLL
jgi:hypothetical protein